MPAAAPAWLLAALDAFHPVADDSPRPAAGVLRPTAGVLPPLAPVSDDTLHGVVPVLSDTLPGVGPVLDDTHSPADILPPAAERFMP